MIKPKVRGLKWKMVKLKGWVFHFGINLWLSTCLCLFLIWIKINIYQVQVNAFMI